MHRAASRALFLAVLLFGASHHASAQAAASKPAAPHVEAGLETAVKWKWWVAPSDEKDWGLPIPEPEPPKPVPGANPSTPQVRPDRYEVQKGDALYNIAKKFGIKVDAIKQFNGITNNIIKVGQVLRIPTEAEIRAMAPPPPPPEEKKPEKKKGRKKDETDKPPELSYETKRELENVKLQIFLDRELFAPGPIDGKQGVRFVKASQLYQESHPDLANVDKLKAKAESTIAEPYTHYVLRREDFRFISPPRAQVAAADPKSSGKKSKSRSSALHREKVAPPTYAELSSGSFLGYRSVWEFVAERFHCDESFLHKLNQKIKDHPDIGTEFQVPAVIPFEIEKAFDSPLQPPADPQNPVTSAVVDLTRLEVRRGDDLIAVVPLSVARPDLRGRGSWTILDVIVRPRMVTREEVREVPKVKATIGSLDSVPMAAAVPNPPLDHEERLPPGPNNPVGIMWINLAKAKSTEPLPYGLNGTSIPGHMAGMESIGGLRLSNWDLVRIVRLLPQGTPLQWKTR